MIELTATILLSAYAQGVFPMAHEDGLIYWHSPNPRAILPLNRLHVSQSLRRAINHRQYEIRIDSAFGAIVEACAAPAKGREMTWINDEIIAAYNSLYRLGYAHSVEVWIGSKLAGGLYGVSLRGLFAGESMFSRSRDASKIALYHLVQRLHERGYLLLDVQYLTDHLARLGAIEIPRDQYLDLLQKALQVHSSFL
jgi:leucyl/phenylalanyl-tRNA--protein transferase